MPKFMPFKDVPFGDAKTFNVVVEVPAGGQKKYEYDSEMDAIKLGEVLYDDLRFPFNYGHVPKTLAGDNDLLDAFVISSYPITTGTVVECRAVGLLEVMDRGKRDNKILAIPVNDTRFNQIQNIEDVPAADIEKFKSFYAALPAAWNREITLAGIKNKEAAVKELLLTQELAD